MITNKPPKFAESFTNKARKRGTQGLNPKSIGVAVSGTNKAVNQDFYSYKYLESVNAHILAIADGVGSHKFAEVGSEFVVVKAVDLLTDLVSKYPESIDFVKLFSDIQNALNYFIQSNYEPQEELQEESCFGTTLLVGIDLPDKFIAAYVGNGSIFNISGYFANFPPNFYLPWNSINMLNPHTIEQNGREALYKLFTWKGNSQEYSPTVFEIHKSIDLPGEIFVLTTDGVNSSDHLLPGKTEDGDIWIPSSKPTELLYQYLKKYLLCNEFGHDEKSLENSLNDYLTELKEKKLMYDDTTLGVLITANCLKYFEKMRMEI